MRFHSGAFAIVLASSASAFHVPSSRTFTRRQQPTVIDTRLHFAPDPPTSEIPPGLPPWKELYPNIPWGGPERLREFVILQRQQRKTSNIKNHKLAKLAGVAAVPLSYIVGAAITPTRYLAAKALAGAVAAVTAGTVGKSAVEEDVRMRCPPAIAQLILDSGVDGVSPASIDDLQSEYGVEDSDFQEMKIDIFSEYFLGMAQNPTVKTSELKELSSLKSALGLNNVQVGQALAEAAMKMNIETSMTNDWWELEDNDHPDIKAVDKFLFLADRLFDMGNETEEAKTFEFSRIVDYLDVYTDEGAKIKIRETANPFYERALRSTRDKLETGQVNSNMLEKARNTLGITEEDARQMSIEAFDEEVRIQLGVEDVEDNIDYDDEIEYDENKRISTDGEGRDLLSKWTKMREDAKAKELSKATVESTSVVKFKEGAFEHLSKLQEILGITDEEAEVCIQSYASDYWNPTALVAFRDVTSNVITPAKCWDIIKQRADELLLKESTIKTMVTNIMIDTMGKPLKKVAGFARVQNAAAVYDGLLDAMEAKEVCKDVCKQAGWDSHFENFEKVLFNPDNERSACGFISAMDRKRMYDLFFSRCIKLDAKGRRMLDAESRDKLKDLRSMLGISDVAGEEQIKNVFGPELNKILTDATQEIMAGNVTETLMETMVNDVKTVIAEFGLDEDMKQQSALPLYEKSVRQIATTTPGGIPSKDEVATLASLKEFLGVNEEDVSNIHLEYFGGAYRKAVKEALGTTGVIRQEFRAPLEDLRNRLGVSDDASKKIFVSAIGERMKPMVEYIAQEMERTVMSNAQLARKRGADYGEDLTKTGKTPDGKLGLGTEGNIMGDIMNLVDFYVENDMIQKKEVGTKKVEKKVTEDGEEKTIEEEVPVYENSYPITAIGKKWMDKNTAELCYRQFLVSSFTEQGPQVARYDANKATFGGILGLTAKDMEEIGSNIGGMVYDNYVTQALSTKDALDQQDMMFLANMQGKLGLSAEQGEEMLLNTQKKILSEEANRLFSKKSKKAQPTPEQIKAFREKCNSMGLDLENDVGLSRARIVNMFTMEIVPGIDSGEITMDSGDLIAEVQESLGLSDEEGEEIIANLITERAAMLYVRIRSSLLRGFDSEALKEINNLIQYARFVDGEFGLQVSERDANHALSVYENSDLSHLDDATAKERLRLLKKALGVWVEEGEEEAAPAAAADSD